MKTGAAAQASKPPAARSPAVPRRKVSGPIPVSHGANLAPGRLPAAQPASRRASATTTTTTTTTRPAGQAQRATALTRTASRSSTGSYHMHPAVVTRTVSNSNNNNNNSSNSAPRTTTAAVAPPRRTSTATATATATRQPATVAQPVRPASRLSSSTSSRQAQTFRRANSFQVIGTGGTNATVSRDMTRLPDELIVMYCHRCFRFSCDRRLPSQANSDIACPTCRHTPVEIPSTRSGLFAMYGRAATKHNADPNSTVALQAMLSLHNQTRAAVVLFRGIPNPPPTPATGSRPSTGTTAAAWRPFVEDRFTPEEIMFTFEQFPDGLGRTTGASHAETTCVVCLEECAGCGRPVVKLQGCGHYFHAACVKPWVQQQHYTCPMCRAPMIARDPQ